jgi:lambda family phage tail tape measure protein
MATRDLSIRLSLTNADAVKSALVELGERGQGALQLIEAASDRAGTSSTRFEATIRRLKESLDPAIRAQADMARGQDMLSDALKRGLVTGDEHGRFLTLLKDRCNLASGAVTAMGNAHGLATWQIQAVSHSVRASAEMLMAGQSPIRTFAMEGMRLTSVFGAGSLAIMGWGAAVAALAAPVALGLSQLMKMEDESRRLSVALKAMGDSARLSVGDLKSVISSSYQHGPFGHDDSVAMVQALLKNNQLSGDSFRRVAGLAGDFASASGQDMAKGAEQLAEAVTHGYEGVKKFDEQWNLLSASELTNIRTLFEHGQKIEAVTLFLDKAEGRFKGLAEDGMGSAAKAAHDLGLAWEHLLESLSHTGMVEGARNALTNLVTDAAALLGNQDAQVTSLKGKITDLQGLRQVVGNDFARGNVDHQLADARAELARLEQARSSGVTVSADGRTLSAPMPAAPVPAVNPANEQADALDRDRKKLVDLQAEYARTAAAMKLPQAQRELALVAMRAEDEALKLNLGTQGAAELKALRLSEAKIKLSATTRDSIATLMHEAQATDLLTNAIGKGFDAKVAAQKQTFVDTEVRKNPFADRTALGSAFDAKAESDRRNREATTGHDLDHQIDAERRLADARLVGAEAARQEGIASEAARRHEDEGLGEAGLRIKLQSLDAERQRQELLSKAKSLNPALSYQEEIEALDRLRQSKEGALVTEEQYSKAYEDAALRRLSAETDWVSGAERALISYRRSIEDSASAMEQGLTHSLKATEDAFVKWATTGKAAASDLFNTIAEEALRAAYRMAIAKPLGGLLEGMMSSLGGLFSGGGSSAAPVGDFTPASSSVMVAHTGGVLGSDSLERRSVDSGLFASAQRFHTGGLPGLGPDEVPIIAKVGEEVLTGDDPRHRANLSRGNGSAAPVVIVQPTINNSVANTQARTETRTGPNGEVMIDVFVEQIEARLGRNISRGTGLAAVLEPRYGLNPAAGAYR